MKSLELLEVYWQVTWPYYSSFKFVSGGLIGAFVLAYP